jgi:hypothetical protein
MITYKPILSLGYVECTVSRTVVEGVQYFEEVKFLRYLENGCEKVNKRSLLIISSIWDDGKVLL